MKKKRIRKRKIALAMAILIAICILVYFVFELVNLLIKPTNIVTVENGKISSETSAEGYIIRDEQVLKGENYKNGISQIKAEGEKVVNLMETGKWIMEWQGKDGFVLKRTEPVIDLLAEEQAGS